MRDGWREVPFADAIDFREGPGIMARDFRSDGVPLIRLAGVKSRNVLDGCNYLDPDMVARRWNHFRVETGDVLLSTSASLGEVAVVGEGAEGAVPYTGIIRMRPATNDVDRAFIPWLLRSPHFAHQVQMAGVGSVMNHFGPSHLRQMSVMLPPLREQHRIARVLSLIDELGETNEMLARTTAAQAEASWRRWVQSETESEVAVAASAEVVLGGTPARNRPEFWGGDIPWLNSGKANDFRVIEPSEFITHDGYRSSSTKLMPAGTTLIAITGATLGQITRLEFEACGNQSLVGVYVPDDRALNDHLYFAIRDRRSVLLGSATGGAQQHINKGNVEALSVVAPDRSVLAQWHVSAGPLLESARELLLEARDLRRTRDQLMPRLLSGEVRADEVNA